MYPYNFYLSPKKYIEKWYLDFLIQKMGEQTEKKKKVKKLRLAEPTGVLWSLKIRQPREAASGGRTVGVLGEELRGPGGRRLGGSGWGAESRVGKDKEPMDGTEAVEKVRQL